MKLRAYLNMLPASQRVVIKDVYRYHFMGSVAACMSEKELWDREVLGTRAYGEEIYISLRVRPKRGIYNG